MCAFVKNNLMAERLSDLSLITESGLHLSWLKVQAGNCNSFLICTAYRPPSTTTDYFHTDFSDVISAMSLNRPIFILGDLNCNLLKSSDPASQVLINVCSSHNLTQLTNLPTRITESPATLIDVILELNKNLARDTRVIPVSSSDHNLVFAVLKLRRQRPTAGMYNDLGFKDY